MSQLPADCLNEIFEYLEKDKATLRSCLLVNRLWCEVSVRILWRNIFDFKYFMHYTEHILELYLLVYPATSIRKLNQKKVSSL